MSESVRAVDRALDVLMCFNRQTPELSMTQIGEQIGIHKSTVHRLLATLEHRRFVQRDPETGMYRLGIRLLQMAYLTLEQNDLRRLAAPFMQRLGQQFQENIHLAILDDSEVVYLSIIESPQRVKLAAAVGQRLPAYATASGKAILAFLPSNMVQRILDQGMPQLTPRTQTSPNAFFEDVHSIRERGFAISEQEFEDDINAVAAPLFDPEGQPIASIAVASPAFRLTHERMMQIGPVLVAATGEISQEVKMAAIPKANSTVDTQAAMGYSK